FSRRALPLRNTLKAVAGDHPKGKGKEKTFPACAGKEKTFPACAGKEKTMPARGHGMLPKRSFGGGGEKIRNIDEQRQSDEAVHGLSASLSNRRTGSRTRGR
ncbi:unnamed protein product, partial [Discosporangium mesarthrocarpum]